MAVKLSDRQNAVIDRRVTQIVRPRENIQDPALPKVISFKNAVEPAPYFLQNIRYSGYYFIEQQESQNATITSYGDYSVTNTLNASGSTGDWVDTVFQDTSQAWTSNQWANYWLKDTEGQYYYITGNDATGLTIATNSGLPIGGSYEIVAHKPNAMVGAYLQPYPDLDVKFRIISNTESQINTENTKKFVYAGSVTAAYANGDIQSDDFVGTPSHSLVDFYITFKSGSLIGTTLKITAFNSATGEFSFDWPITTYGWSVITDNWETITDNWEALGDAHPAAGDAFIIVADVNSLAGL